MPSTTNPLISVIVPVYNVEQYLDQCIQSILNQTYSNFELILINDGSTDRSGEICDTYALKDKRIKVFHQENAGVSAARNLGLDHAKGEWVTFVDSDDYLGKDYLKEFIILIVDDSKLIIQSLSKIDNENYNFQSNINICVKIFETREFIVKNNISKYGFAGGKLFNSKVLKKNKILFNVNSNFGEDYQFLIEYLFYINKLTVSTTKNYFYRIMAENSLSKLQNTFDEEYTRLFVIKDLLDRLFHKNNINYDNQYIHYHNYFLRALNSIYLNSPINRFSLIIKLSQLFPKNFYNTYKDSKILGFFILKAHKLKYYKLMDFLIKFRYFLIKLYY